MTSHGGAKLGSLGAVLLTLGTAFACTVEDNLPIGDWVGGTGAAGAGGSAGSGGTAGAGGSGTAGSAGTAGTGTTAGSGASLDVGCDYVTVLNSNCARSACHNARSQIAYLDLTPTSAEGLVARLKDKPAGHAEIDCGEGGAFKECVPATCPPPGAALLVDSANPDESWILKKLNGTHDDCGQQMPIAPGDANFDDTRKACVTELVHAIAALGGSECYSPTNPPSPDPSVTQVGCACDGEDDVCVVLEDGHHMALTCNGRWLSVEDGACEPPLATARCQLKYSTYTEIVEPGTRVSSPFDGCSNPCTCGTDGSLECPDVVCAATLCESGTEPGEHCLGCGPAGGCELVESGCLEPCESNDECGGETPVCENGFCSVGPCL